MKLYSYVNLIIVHVLIGFSIQVFRPISRAYFLAIFIIALVNIIKSTSEKRVVYVLSSCAYIIGAEVFLRMTGGFLFYEVGKYCVVLFIFLGIILGDRLSGKGAIYLLFIFLLLPGVFVAIQTLEYTINIRKAIAFNISGPICLGLVAFYCYNRSIVLQSLQKVLLWMLLPLISTLTYLFFYSSGIGPGLGTDANFHASGGFGPNQVSTVLGLGAFLIISRLFLQAKTKKLKVINLVLLLLMLYRGIITFSRGGVFTAAIISSTYIISIFNAINKKRKKQIIMSASVLLVGIISTWMISSYLTGGMIDKRYANQNALGEEKADITTGRAYLMSNEINEFFDNPFFGVGVGRLKELRIEKEGLVAASHNEMTRIIAEHGVFGVLAFLILLIMPLAFRMKNGNNIYFYSFYFFWFLTINHSAMRIGAPAFVYGLCLLNVFYEKTPVHRKRSIGAG